MKSKNKFVDEPQEWEPHVPHLVEWRSPFDVSVLRDFSDREQTDHHDHSKLLANMAIAHRSEVPISAVENVFGSFHPHHSFCAPILNWRMKLREPTVTQTLADFLAVGAGETRARRIHAFLTALHTPNVPSLGTLEGCLVMAEKDRIDLEIWIPCSDSDRYRPVIIEAKFEHKITKGQLKKYTDIRRQDRSLQFDEKHCVVLGLSYKAMKGVSGKQRKLWKFVAWRDLWTRFEKLRPREDNPSFSIFLRLLWLRIGALK